MKLKPERKSMKVVNLGSTLRIFSDDLTVEDRIPAGTYDVNFDPMSGYSLSMRPNFKTTEKVYGNHLQMVDRMLDRYNKIDGNFGTILGGRKGTGKSMTARIVSEKLLGQDIPTILVTENTPGLPRFLQSIEQPALILIDEFEKIFNKGEKDTEDEQVQFLSLFDGLVNNHHFYLITINDYNKLNQYFIGRTGRFYYDITYESLSSDEVKDYLADKLNNTHNLNRLASLLYRINVNYDQLQAITSELNYGESVENILDYLNSGLDDNTRYRHFDVTYTFSTGVTFTEEIRMDLLYPALHRNLDLVTKSKDGKMYSYDFNFGLETDAFSFDGDTITIDMNQIEYGRDYNADRSADDYVLGKPEDLVDIRIKPAKEVKIAY